MHELARPWRPNAASSPSRFRTTTPVGIPQEPEAGQWTSRLLDPAKDIARPRGQGRGESRCMALHGVPVGGTFGQGDDPTDREGSPAVLLREEGRDHANLAIQRTDQVLQVDDRRFHLDDQERSRSCVPCRHVDRSSIAEVIEGVLDDDLESARAEVPHDEFHDRRMALVKQLGQVRASPAWLDVKRESKGGPDAPRVAETGRLDLADFDQRHGLLAQSSRPGDVHLTPATAPSHGSEDAADRDVIHASSLQPEPRL